MKFLVTAGPTREFLDPVRYLGNRSSGRMGYAVAAAAHAHGYEVVLISGPASLSPPEGVTVINVVSACDMLTAVATHVVDCDVLVMCAAVADWRPKTFSDQKLKKRETASTIELEANPDILSEVHPLKGNRIFIGFAAETDNILSEARSKLLNKGLDMIVVNDITRADAGFEVDTNVVTFITPDDGLEPLPLMSKADVATHIVAWAEARHAKRM